MKEINLLPQARKKNIFLHDISSGVFKIFWVAMASFALVLLLHFLGGIYLKYKISKTDKAIAVLKTQVDQKENALLKQKIKQINDSAKDFNELTANSPKAINVIEAFAVLVPSGVRITSLRADLEKKTVEINGQSPTRQLVLDLHKNIMEDEKDFANIDYPLENLSKPENVSFHFSFSIKDELLK